MDQTHTLIIGVAGGSGSGKTTTCESLAGHFGDLASVLSSDNYYRAQSHLSKEERDALNFDHPDAIDFELLAKHLEAIKRGESIEVPTYDFSTHNRTGMTTQLVPCPILFVEGILLFADPAVRKQLDFLIFVAASDPLRFQRRLHRDVRERGRTEESVREQWDVSVAPMYEQFVEPTQSLAQIVINTDEEAKDCELDSVAILAAGIRDRYSS